MKSKIRLALVFPAVLGLASPVSGEASGPAVATATAAPVDEGTIDIVAKKLCFAEPIIGTRIAPKRKCDTPAQLQQYRQQAREMIEEYKRRPCMAGAGAGPNDTPLSC